MKFKKNARPVYAADRVTVLAYVSNRATSIGAAKAAGAKSCFFGKACNKDAWIVCNK